MSIKPLDTLLAIKTINLVPNLRPSERKVSVALLEHYNRRTGRCDPSLERLAKLLSLSERTVIRSTQALEKAGLFGKDRHGGYSNRNAYKPNWLRFAELDAAWREKFAGGARSRPPRMSPASREQCHGAGDSAVTQTYLNNLPNRTCKERHPNEGKRTKAFARPVLSPIKERVRPGEAALAAAERRWTAELHERFASIPITYGEVIGAIDESMRAAATEAELARHGAGIAYILKQLKIPNR